MKIEIYAISDMGRVRKNNEDMALLGALALRDGEKRGEIVTDKPVALAVADGIGGAEGGEIASALVINSLLDFAIDLEDSPEADGLVDRLKEWAEVTNRLLLMRIDRLGNSGMGTTLTGLLFTGSEVLMYNAGDSRLYRLRDGILRQLSTDHSMRELTGRDDIPGNIMYNAFGKVDGFFIDVEVVGNKLLQDDILLLCSDGLSDMLSHDEIEQALGDANPARALVDGANAAGGKDNITVIVIKIIER